MEISNRNKGFTRLARLAQVNMHIHMRGDGFLESFLLVCQGAWVKGGISG